LQEAEPLAECNWRDGAGYKVGMEELFPGLDGNCTTAKDAAGRERLRLNELWQFWQFWHFWQFWQFWQFSAGYL